MEILLLIIYLYILLYSLYFLILSVRNLNDKSFYIEKKYSKFDEVKRNFAVVIYSHNHKDCLLHLVDQLKNQDYPLADFKVYAILDSCNDGSEKLFEQDNFVHVVNIQDDEMWGKNKAITELIKELSKDTSIDAYVFIDDVRHIEANFLTLANSALLKSNIVTGELYIDDECLDFIESIKAVRKKYQANFFKQARTLLGLATQIDSGLLIARKEVFESIDEITFKDVNHELEFSLKLSKLGYKCVYNPNIKSFIRGQDCKFSKPKLSTRFELLKSTLKNINDFSFSYIEHICSLLRPNCWTLILGYLCLIAYSYKYSFIVKCNIVVLSAIVLFAIFCISLIGAKLTSKEIFQLFLYPLYSICHIIKNLPPVRTLLKKIGANTDKEVDKLEIVVNVITKYGERPCTLEFISTESGLNKIRFIYKNKKYTTASHIRMLDALQQLKSKMDDYGLVLKICNCCKYFSSLSDGTKNMLKGVCNNDFPSPLLNEKRHTLIWNSCSNFEVSEVSNIIEEIAMQIDNSN